MSQSSFAEFGPFALALAVTMHLDYHGFHGLHGLHGYGFERTDPKLLHYLTLLNLGHDVTRREERRRQKGEGERKPRTTGPLVLKY